MEDSRSGDDFVDDSGPLRREYLDEDEEGLGEIESEICPTEPDEMEDFETEPAPYLDPLPRKI